MKEKKQDITGIIKDGSKVTQVGEIHIHVHKELPKHERKITKAYLIYCDKKGKERKLEVEDRLIIYREEGGWRIFAKNDKEIHLGILDVGISRRGHAEFYIKRGKLYVRDLESRNGTFVNGRRIKNERLREGDLVRIGPSLTFRVEYEDNRITVKRFYPIPISEEIATNLPDDMVVRVGEEAYLIANKSMEKEIGGKIIKVEDTNIKEDINNVKNLINENAPHELVKKALSSIAEEIKGEKAKELKKLGDNYGETLEIKKEILNLLKEIAEEL